MLVITQRVLERFAIGDNVVVTIMDIDGGKVRVGIEAPDDVPIMREELVSVAEFAAIVEASQGKAGETNIRHQHGRRVPTVPADEDEAITPEWLESAGGDRFIRIGGGVSYGFFGNRITMNIQFGLTGSLTNIEIGNRIVLPITPRTRGDLRLLCRALGIVLKPSTGG